MYDYVHAHIYIYIYIYTSARAYIYIYTCKPIQHINNNLVVLTSSLMFSYGLLHVLVCDNWFPPVTIRGSGSP